MSFLQSVTNKAAAALGMGSKTDDQQSAQSQQQTKPPAPNPGSNEDPNAGKTLKEVDPLESFKMFHTVKDDATDVAPVFELDDTALDGAAAQMDFTRGIPAQLLADADAGDAKANREVNKLMAANAYKAALKHSSTLTGRFTEARMAHEGRSFGSRVRGELTSSALSENTAFQNPTVRKQLTTWAVELQKQHPDASPKEIAQMAQDYLITLSDAANPRKADPASSGPKATNWDEYFDN